MLITIYTRPPILLRRTVKKKLLHARILPKGTIPADKFRELVHKATGFSPAILDGTLQAITDELHSWLADGWIVEVGELGFFSLSLKCDKAVANKRIFALRPYIFRM